MTTSFITTCRRDGDLRAPGALARYLKARHLPDVAATAEQVHGHAVVVVPSLARARTFANADGLLTGHAEQPLAIFTADCASLFLADTRGIMVGVLHAGWRGVRGKILKNALGVIGRQWQLEPKDIQVWLGPCIGSCCFQVQWDVARYFPRTRRRLKDRWVIDMAKELEAQARALGACWVRKKVLGGCTMHGSRYFSYRRDGTSKRQASIIIKRRKA